MLDAVISVTVIDRSADCLLCFCKGLIAVLTAFLFISSADKTITLTWLYELYTGSQTHLKSGNDNFNV